MKKITFVKHLSFFIALFCAVNFGFGQMNDLIISEYGEGSVGNNKYIELFNGTGANVNLANYQIWRVSNGGTWPEAIISLSGTLTNGSTYVIANGAADATILAAADFISGAISWNGNDAAGLAKDDGTGTLTFVLIDAVGTDGADPGTGWDVAGTTNATRDHTLVRKPRICNTNTNWVSSAGTTVDNSEWIVLPNQDWSNIGTHNTDCCIYSSTWTSTGWLPSAPTINTSVTIDYAYNTVSNGSFSACGLTVNSGAILTVNDGTFVKIQNSVNVSGEIFVETQGAFVQIDDSGTFNLIGSGTSSVNKVTPPKQQWYFYTYWSSPVKNQTIGNAFPNTDADRRFWFNANNYLDQHTVGTTNGIPDDIDDNIDDWQIALSGDFMLPGVGYAATAGPFHIPGGLDSADFIGEFNTGNIPTSISYNALNTLGSWNLIGNPYPCALDFTAFQAANSSFIDGTVYFWSQATAPSGANPGNEILNFSKNDYAIFTAGSGGIKADAFGNMPNGFIPSGQAFFIAGKANGNVTFTNAMRVANGTSNSQFFKNTKSKDKSNSTSNKLWVNLTSDNGVFNQVLVAYVDGATNNDDGLFYDASKLPSEASATLYSQIEGSNKKFAIQGKDANSINEDEIINLGFKTTIDVATLYKLSIAQLEGEFLTNNSIFLVDLLLNKVHDLSVCDYTFTSAVGEFNSRFEIAFTNKALSVNDVQLNTKAFKIVELQDDLVQFNTNNNLTIKAVNIYDLLGRELYRFKGENTSETYRLSNLKNTVYIAKVSLSDGTLVTKKAVKK